MGFKMNDNARKSGMSNVTGSEAHANGRIQNAQVKKREKYTVLEFHCMDDVKHPQYAIIAIKHESVSTAPLLNLDIDAHICGMFQDNEQTVIIWTHRKY